MAKKKVNPWAICHKSTGPKKTAKFERCVMDVKKKHGMESLEKDDIRKISEMLTDDPDVFNEEGMPLTPDNDMVGGDAPPPMGAEDMPAADDGMPDDMAPEGDMPPMEEEGGQWIIVKMGMGEGEEGEAWGPYGSREEAVQELKSCLEEEGMGELAQQAETGKVTGEGFTKMVMQLQSGAEEGMPGEEEIGGEDLPPMGEEPAPEMGAGGPPAEEEAMGTGALGMSGGMY